MPGTVFLWTFQQLKMRLPEVLDSTVWRYLSLLTTLYVLVNDQITILLLPKGADLYMGLGTATVFTFFVVEMVITSIANKGYLGKGFFVQDLTAIISLIPDILLWVFGIQSLSTLQNLVVSRAGRIARMGMRFGRMGRITDIVALLGGTEEGRKADDATDPTFIGRILLDVTNRKVILGVIVLLFVLPYFNVVESDKTMELEVRELLAVPPILFNVTLSTIKSSHPELLSLILDKITLISKDTSNLRSMEVVHFAVGNRASGLYDIADQVKWNATVSLISTGFVVLLLLLGAMMFSSDLNHLVIRPVERLKLDMDKISSSFDQLNSEGKDNLLGHALDNIGTVIQVAVTLSKRLNTSSRERLALTLKEAAISLGASQVCLFCTNPMDPDTLEHVKSHNLSNIADECFDDPDNPPQFVFNIADAVRYLLKPILINNWNDILQIQKALTGIRLDDDDDRVKLRKYSMMASPLVVGSQFIGVLYVHKLTIFHKDVTKFLGDSQAKSRQAPPKGIVLLRKNSLRVFKRNDTAASEDAGIFLQKDLQLLNAAGNQVAIMVSLIRAVSMNVEKKWTSTKVTYDNTIARNRSLLNQVQQERQYALQLVVSGFDRNSLRSVADVPIPRSAEGSDTVRNRAATLAGTAVWPRVSLVNDVLSELSSPRELFLLGSLMAGKSDGDSLVPTTGYLNGRDARLLLSHCIDYDTDSFIQREDLLQQCGTSSIAVRLVGGLLKQRENGMQRWTEVLNKIKSEQCTGEVGVIAASIHDLQHHELQCMLDIATHPAFCPKHIDLVVWWSVHGDMKESHAKRALDHLTNDRFMLVPCANQSCHLEQPIRQYLQASISGEEWTERQAAWIQWIDETMIPVDDSEDIVQPLYTDDPFDITLQVPY